MDRKKIRNCRIAIIVLCAFLGLLAGASVTVALHPEKDISESVYEGVQIGLYFASLALLLVIFVLFNHRQNLIHKSSWMKNRFHDVAGLSDQGHVQTRLSRYVSMGREGAVAALCLYGRHSGILTSYESDVIKTMNEITLAALRKHYDGRKNLFYGLNPGNDWVLAGIGVDPNDFFREWKEVGREIANAIDSHDALPAATVLLGGYLFHKGESAEASIDHARFALRSNPEGRLSADLVLYEASMGRAQEDKRDLGIEIDKALANNEFRVYYQPKFDLKTGRFYGAEALIRWQHPRRGLVPPSIFIPYCEASGRIVDIDRFMFTSVAKDLAEWEGKIGRDLVVSVNLSRRTVYAPNLITFFAETIQSTKVNPAKIDVEMTESLAAEDSIFISSIIRKIKGLGMETSIDDFGIGYSSLSCLKRIPFDTLKIDKSFIDDIEVDEKSRSMVSSIIALVHDLQMKTLAEGVETAHQVDLLQRMGLDAIQGYYYSAPIAKDAFLRLLSNNKFERPLPEKDLSKKGGAL